MKVKQLTGKKKMNINDLPNLIFKIGDLMQEGYTLAEAITLLLPYYTKDVEYWLDSIQTILQQGYDASAIFEKMGVRNEFLLAIYFAEKHGNLAPVLVKISQQMATRQTMQNKLKKLLTYPIFMFIVLFSFFIGFRMIFLPHMEQLMNTRMQTSSSKLSFSKILLHTPDYFLLVVALLLATLVLLIVYLKRKSTAFQLRIYLAIPIFKTIYQLNLTRQFAQILGTLLTTGFSMQEALKQIRSQDFKLNLTYVAKQLESRILLGDTFTQSIKLFPFFTPKFELYANHGETNGLLGKELILYSEILDQKLYTTISFLSSFIQPVLFTIIAICILAAYLSMLLPIYKMLDLV